MGAPSSLITMHFLLFNAINGVLLAGAVVVGLRN